MWFTVETLKQFKVVMIVIWSVLTLAPFAD